MAVIVACKSPGELLSRINEGIESGKIVTWSVDGDGDYTHAAEQWNRRAWLRPVVKDGQLIFNIFPPKGKVLSKTIYGVFHGRFIEMLLVHFDKEFSAARSTALATDGDNIGKELV